MKVYIVIESDYDGQYVHNVYTTEAAAQREADAMTYHKTENYGSYAGISWYVEEWDVVDD